MRWPVPAVVVGAVARVLHRLRNRKLPPLPYPTRPDASLEDVERANREWVRQNRRRVDDLAAKYIEWLSRGGG